MKTPALFVAAACLLALSARADDWPQWRGPNRDDVSKETGLLKEWPAGGPKLLWTFKGAGNGYSCPTIVGDVLYTQGARGGSEYVFALDLTKTPPAEKWAVKMGPTFTWEGNIWNRGPSATPCVAGGHVYAIGGQGEMVCVDVAKGTEVWHKSLLKDLGGEVNPIGGDEDNKLAWGYAGSPLVEGDNVICVPGGPKGTVAALNARTGAVVWRSKGLTEQATYSSVMTAEIGSRRQYVVATQKGAAGVDAKTGDLLWEYERKPYGDIVAATPVIHDDLVFITAIKGGSDLIKVTTDGGKFTAAKVYADRKIENHTGGVLRVGDHLYGCSGESRGRWFCLEFKTGKTLWSEADNDVGKGSLTCADGNLYLLGEDTGEVGLAAASPTGWKLSSHFTLPEQSKGRQVRGKVWTHPVVANGKLYLRDQDLIFCYAVK